MDLERWRQRLHTRDLTLLAHRDLLAPVPDSVLLNLSNVRANEEAQASAKPKSTIFGPWVEQPKSIGGHSTSGVGSGNSSSGTPTMTKKPLPIEKKVIPKEVVQTWVDRSKDGTQATTTLQALVNLKTSSLRLFPLNVTPEDEPSTSTAISSHDAPHCLEFTYDCDAPKAKISIDVYSKKRPDGKSSKVSVYSQVFEGGFGKSLKMEDGATLELSHIVTSLKLDTPNDTGVSTPPEAKAGQDGDGDGDRTPIPTEAPILPSATPASNSALNVATPTTPSAVANRRSRLSTLPFRRRNREDVAGPALRVVDVDAVTTEVPAVAAIATPKKAAEVHVRVSLNLEALDEAGNPLKAPNSQTTRLVIVRTGQPPRDEDEEDSRHWTVQVVRRDATIGAHTFRLQDIYGLSSHHKPSHPPSAGTEPVASYPPPATPATPVGLNITPPVITNPDDDEGPSSECLVCLSSPREVVLLPCRHLVACKDCALNMVEYGAGGQVTQPAEEPSESSAAPAPAAAATVADSSGAGPSSNTSLPAEVDPNVDIEAQVHAGAGVGTETEAEATSGEMIPPPVAPMMPGAPNTAAPAPPAAAIPRPPRRKKRAKGWYCPVCRQPYTSMLRISTVSDKDKASPGLLTSPPQIPRESEDTRGESFDEMTSTGHDRPHGPDHDDDDRIQETGARLGDGWIW